LRKDGMVVINRENGVLVVVLVVPEEKQTISFNRSTQRKTGLPPREKGRRGSRIARKAWISRQVVVAIEEQPCPVESVFTTSRNDIDNSTTGCTGRQIEIECRNLKFLHRLLREVLCSTSHESVIHGGTIN